MKRILALLAALVLTVPAFGELRFTSVSATATSQTVSINAQELTIKNDGANSVYVRVFVTGEIPAAATTAYSVVKLDETLALKAPGNEVISAISLKCDTAETATVRLYYW